MLALDWCSCMLVLFIFASC